MNRQPRSYVRREGRVTRGQARALADLWPRYGLEADGPAQGAEDDAPTPETSPVRPWDLDAVFGRTAPRVLEIGFGDGEALVEMAAAEPARDFIGTEVHRPGVGHCLIQAESAGVDNLRVTTLDADDVLSHCLTADTLAAIHVFFPDPWPKKRHHKRRLIQPAFLDQAARVLASDGVLHVATDWPDYAEWIEATLEADPRFENLAGSGAWPPPPPRPETKFERRGIRRGHPVADYRYRLLGPNDPSGGETTLAQ